MATRTLAMATSFAMVNITMALFGHGKYIHGLVWPLMAMVTVAMASLAIKYDNVVGHGLTGHVISTLSKIYNFWNFNLKFGRKLL